MFRSSPLHHPSYTIQFQLKKDALSGCRCRSPRPDERSIGGPTSCCFPCWRSIGKTSNRCSRPWVHLTVCSKEDCRDIDWGSSENIRRTRWWRKARKRIERESEGSNILISKDRSCQDHMMTPPPLSSLPGDCDSWRMPSNLSLDPCFSMKKEQDVNDLLSSSRVYTSADKELFPPLFPTLIQPFLFWEIIMQTRLLFFFFSCWSPFFCSQPLRFESDMGLALKGESWLGL